VHVILCILLFLVLVLVVDEVLRNAVLGSVVTRSTLTTFWRGRVYELGVIVGGGSVGCGGWMREEGRVIMVGI